MIQGAHLAAKTQSCLLVDDHAKFRRLLRDFLPQGFVAAGECADGNEVLAKYQALQPDWVLMDIEMPSMDGLTATRLIRDEFPKARVIILTQHDSPAIRDAAFEAGAFAFFGKDHLHDLSVALRQTSENPDTSLPSDSPFAPQQ